MDLLQLISSTQTVILVVTVCVTLFLIFIVGRSSLRSTTNVFFILLSFITTAWLVMTYLSLLPNFFEHSLILTRMTFFFAAFMSAFIFLLSHTIPYEALQLNRKKFYAVIFITLALAVFILSPYAIVDVEIKNDSLNLVFGFGIIPFFVIAFFFSVFSVYFLIKKFKNSVGTIKQQIRFVVLGMLLMLFLIITTILIPVIVFNNNIFVPFISFYTLIFLSATAYAILKYHLFNIKTVTAEFLTFSIWITLLVRIFISENSTDKIIGVSILLATVIFGIMLIKSVLNEVKMREKTEALYKELKEADEKLKKIDEEKSEFVFIVSHQLRTPMTVIKGYISMMIEGDFGEISTKLREVLQKVYISNERLVKIINDLLDLSRIERGKMDYSLKEQQFERIVSEAIIELKPYAKDKKLKMTFKKPKKGLPSVLIDEDYTRQVVVNLIDNAIKYSDKGEVKVKIEKKKDSVLLSIKDKGMGISEDMISHLFHRYSREEKTYSKASRGMGLGLYIAKRIITDQHGRIWAESKGQGMGATFFVELPVEK